MSVEAAELQASSPVPLVFIYKVAAICGHVLYKVRRCVSKKLITTSIYQ